MLGKGKLSQIRTAFKNVYGVPGLDEQELIRYGNEIIFFAEPFPFETEDLMSFRFSTISEISESDAIVEYLSKVPEGEFSGDHTSTYGKLFELGKKYGIGYQGESNTAEPGSKGNSAVEASPEPEPQVEDIASDTHVSNSNPEKDQSEGYNPGMEYDGAVAHQTNLAASSNDSAKDSATINSSTTHPEEEKKMNAIEQLAQEAGQSGVGSTVGSNVAEVSKNDKLAAKKVVESTQMDRINYSKNAKIGKVLITAIDREKKAVQGRASMGYVSNPKKAFDTFVSKTGCTVEDGVVKFSKLHSSQLHDDAVKMYNLLKSAIDTPDTQVEPYFGKEGAVVPVSIKGIVIDDPAKQEITLAQKDIAAHILQHAFLFLNVDSKSNAQFQLDAATSRAGAAPKKSYVVRVANKSELIEDESVVVYVKKILTTVSESRTGFKSALSVSCNSSKPDAQGNPKKVTWRIPLEVEQYEVEVVDKYSDLFKSGVGNTVKPMNAATEADITNIVDKITNMIAAEATKSSGESIVGAGMLAQVNEAKSEIVSADAASVNETLGATAKNEEFEG
jgi:hypothetical protein